MGVPPSRPAAISHPRRLTLPGLVATWSGRMRLRWQLARMAEAGPHLVDDIGLTRGQIEAEIAKPFWRA